MDVLQEQDARHGEGQIFFLVSCSKIYLGLWGAWTKCRNVWIQRNTFCAAMKVFISILLIFYLSTRSSSVHDLGLVPRTHSQFAPFIALSSSLSVALLSSQNTHAHTPDQGACRADAVRTTGWKGLEWRLNSTSFLTGARPEGALGRLCRRLLLFSEPFRPRRGDAQRCRVKQSLDARTGGAGLFVSEWNQSGAARRSWGKCSVKAAAADLDLSYHRRMMQWVKLKIFYLTVLVKQEKQGVFSLVFATFGLEVKLG